MSYCQLWVKPTRFSLKGLTPLRYPYNLYVNIQSFQPISANQSAFVAERTIVQSVLICQDLVRLYNRKATTKSCLIKIDLRKAYDTAEWEFVQEMMYTLNFPSKFIKWTMTCITTTKYSITLNGGLYGNIEDKRGLRQEDPISPLIFVICMEYFTCIMKHVTTLQGFAFHTKCKRLQLNHLCFADDVLIFYRGDIQSVVIMMRGLASFSNASGLNTNASKSNIYSANMDKQSVKDLCELTGYKKGTLPFRYLGVPISAKKISAVDCEMLVDKMIFLWDGEANSNKVPLVAWELVYRPKQEGGLRIIDCDLWNQAAIAKYVWNIAKKKLWRDMSSRGGYQLRGSTQSTVATNRDKEQEKNRRVADGCGVNTTPQSIVLLAGMHERNIDIAEDGGKAVGS
uniref:Uncharacterized protein LOC104213930 n=1 Tax=Nicotiana sylvestris TaxID=4096 RepID=A0A1U7V9Y6_NICSY|nr:PREDICTED: uncharacterized protein LOC104213930 [Nicotiana sylvestris]